MKDFLWRFGVMLLGVFMSVSSLVALEAYKAPWWMMLSWFISAVLWGVISIYVIYIKLTLTVWKDGEKPPEPPPGDSP